MHRGFWYSLLSVVLMSMAGPLFKFASQTASIGTVTFYSCLAAFLGSVVLFLWTKAWRLAKKNLLAVFLLSILYTTAMLSFSFASKNENPALVSLLSRSNVIFSFLISFLFFREPFNSRIGFGLLFILVGTVSLLSTNVGISVTTGTILVIYYAFAFSIHNGVLKTLKNEEFLSVLLVQNVFACSSIFILSSNKEQFYEASILSIGFAAAAGLLSSFLGFVCYQKGLSLSSFGEATAVRSLSPVIALAVTYPFFPFTFDQYKLAGSIFILLGVAIFCLFRGSRYENA